MNHPLDDIANAAFLHAVNAGRAGALLEHLFNGGGLTRAADGNPVWLPAELIKQAAEQT